MNANTFPPMRGRYRLIGDSPHTGRRVAIASRKTRDEIEERETWYGGIGYTDMAIIPPADDDEPVDRRAEYGGAIRVSGETWQALQALAYGFRGDDLGTPDKVIAKLIEDSDARFVLDALGCETLKEAKQLVDAGRATHDDVLPPRTYDLTDGFKRTATAAELAEEPDGVLESLANGDLAATEATRHLAAGELDYRRRQR